jgi:hypothetical protein
VQIERILDWNLKGLFVGQFPVSSFQFPVSSLQLAARSFLFSSRFPKRLPSVTQTQPLQRATDDDRRINVPRGG